jgi:hypothetical protein
MTTGSDPTLNHGIPGIASIIGKLMSDDNPGVRDLGLDRLVNFLLGSVRLQ